MPHHTLRHAIILLSAYALPILSFHIPPSSLRREFCRSHCCQKRDGSKIILSGANNDNEKEIAPPSSSDEDKMLYNKLQQRHDEIQIEKTRNALEKQHTNSFLRKIPIKLPYKEARKWVQANLGVNTKEEFEDFVAMGYIQTPYISKDPERYYSRTGDWISWDHFLNDLSDIEPKSGVFD